MEKIKVSHLVKISPEQIYICNDISLTVHAGEIFALVGVSGSGKTAVTKTLQHLIFPTSGEYEFNHNDAGLLMQSQNFYDAKSVEDTVASLARLNKRRVSYGQLLNILNLVGLYRRRHTKIKDLSPSMITRLKLAIAIAARPGVLILDEPFENLSDTESRHVRVILKTLADRFDTAVLLTAKDFSGIEEIFDTMSIIEGGRLIATESYNTLARRNDHFAKTCITTPVPNHAADVIHKAFGYRVNLYGEHDVIVGTHPDNAQEIYDFLISAKVPVDGVSRVNRSIKDLFGVMRAHAQVYSPYEAAAEPAASEETSSIGHFDVPKTPRQSTNNGGSL